ncbi:MAG: DNA polymerase III subunit alpha [Clostridia bacterium]|nr:DNA polymerase III subunit alpha [Clostridia bacterium]
MGFVHLHLHTQYSLLDGACKIGEALDQAKRMGQSALAITDHGNMYGVIDFYKEAKKRGIRPIIGCEVYVAPRSRFQKEHALDASPSHLVLLCENNEGYTNLMELVSRAWTEGFYNRPRVDYELLRRYHGGLIALSACLSGEIPRAIQRADMKAAREKAVLYREIFGENHFFLELQDHGIDRQKTVNAALVNLSRELSIPLVATNDCHCVLPEDVELQRVLLAIQTGKTVNDPNLMDMGSGEFYLKSETQMRALFPNQPDAVENTEKIAQRCSVEIEFGKIHLPVFTPPKGENSETYFSRLCHEGLMKRCGGNPPKEYTERLRYEISVISKMGFVNYYLIVQDYVNYAKRAGIPVGPGRGSGAGSLAAYCIGITDVDPMRFNLLFERFLNPERISMPDFDVDFSDERRSEVIDYVIRRYGEDHVSQIVAFDTMLCRGAIRDTGRALGMSYSRVDTVAKAIPHLFKVTINEILSAKPGESAYSEDFLSMYRSDPEIHELIELARRVEGTPRHPTTHAAGVVITDKPVRAYVPLAKNDEAVVTQYTMTQLEEIGLVKMDFLGLRNLSIIEHTEEMIRKKDPDFSFENIDDTDEETFRMISMGYTLGVFQLESAGMKRVLMQSKPRSIEDLTAIISLYRPGPMSFIPDYIKNRSDPGHIRYEHPLLEPILKETAGCIIYQEQVMEICRSLAGYSFGRADLVRRAMAKKKNEEMIRERKFFVDGIVNEAGEIEVEGCVRRGVPRAVAEKLFDEMESFASYAFNKSHAAAYSVVAFRTGYLKAHYPREYLSALLTSVLGDSGKLSDYIAECSRLSIRVLPPHVNYSEDGFTVEGNDIRFGLVAVKNLGFGLIRTLVKERERGGPFRDLYDFCKRMAGRELNKKALESLIKSGALDNLGNNRREMLNSSGDVFEAAQSAARQAESGQIGFFDLPELRTQDTFRIPAMQDVSESEKIEMEHEVTGLYLSAHPLDPYRLLYTEAVTKLSALSSQESDLHDGDTVEVIGLLQDITVKQTKSEKPMAFLNLEDYSGAGEILVFPELYLRKRDDLAVGGIYRVHGKISLNENRPSSILAERIDAAEKPSARKYPEEAKGQKTDTAGEARPKKSSRPGLYLRVPDEHCEEYEKAMKYLAIFEGETPLYLYFTGRNTLVRAPQDRFITPNEPLLRALKALLGEKNVALVENNN